MQDKSWRVRYNVAQQLPGVAEMMGIELAQTELLQCVVRLLKDTEAEVRAAISSKLAAMCRFLPSEQASGAEWPCRSQLLGVNCSGCLSLVGFVRAHLTGGRLWPVCHSKLVCIVQLIVLPLPLQVVLSIVPCIKDLANDSNQYVRSALAGVVMELAPILGKVRTRAVQGIQEPCISGTNAMFGEGPWNLDYCMARKWYI
jgi:hypothetical protein